MTGKLKVSGELLDPPSSDSRSTSDPSTCTASVTTRNFNNSTLKHFDLPTDETSSEALEFIGFVPSVANEIFRNYQARPDPTQNPDRLINYVYGHILLLNSRRCANMTHRQAMTRIGLTQKLQDAILDPRFSGVFGTESLHYWVRDTLKINYDTIYLLQQRLENHTLGSNNESDVGSVQEGSPGAKAGVGTVQLQPPTTISTITMTPEDHALPANHIALESEGPLLPDHIALYKSTNSAEMTDHWIQDDGSLNMDMLASHTGGDFSYNRSVWYWTPEKETAELYRGYASLRCTWSETWLIRIQVPVTFLTGLRKSDLWFYPDWKEYICYCKKRERPPAKFDSIWREGPEGVDIIRGHICTSNSIPVTQIEREDVQTRVTGDWLLLYRDGAQFRKSTQYAFMQYESVNRMGEAIRGKIHVEISAATALHEENPATPVSS